MNATSKIILRSARITGSIVLLFLLFMLIGHLAGDANGAEGMTFSDDEELIAFLLFPIGTIVGLALAYGWPVLGGVIATASLMFLCILRPDLLQLTFLAMAIPGALYLLHGMLLTRNASPAD